MDARQRLSTAIPILLTVILSVFFVQSSIAQTPVVWSGLGNDHLWSNGNNWVGTTVPTTAQSVKFADDATVIINTAVSVSGLELVGGADVNLTTNATLTVTGTTSLGAGAEILLAGTAAFSLQLNGNVRLEDGNSASDPTRIWFGGTVEKLVRVGANTSATNTISMTGIANAHFGPGVLTIVQPSSPFASDVRFESSLQFTTTSNILLGAHDLYLGRNCNLTVTGVFGGNDAGFIATAGDAISPQGCIRREFSQLGDAFNFPVGPPGGRMSPIFISMPAMKNPGFVFGSATPWPHISVRCLLNGNQGHPENTQNSKIWVYWPVQGYGISEPVSFDGLMSLHNNYRSGSPTVYSARYTPLYENVQSNGFWDLTGSQMGNTQGNNRLVPFSGFPGFGDYNIGSGSSPLPVELISFSARLTDNSVRLNWETATELNNFGFAIERSQEGESWEEVGFVPGAGTSSSPKSYTHEDFLTDELKRLPQIAYRLRQMDRDGTTDYSNIVFVSTGEMPGGIELYAAYPNPFNPATTISFTISESANVTLKVYNTLGQVVATLLAGNVMNAGLHTVPFNGDQLPSGIYMAVLEANGAQQHQKLVLNK